MAKPGILAVSHQKLRATVQYTLHVVERTTLDMFELRLTKSIQILWYSVLFTQNALLHYAPCSPLASTKQNNPSTLLPRLRETGAPACMQKKIRAPSAETGLALRPTNACLMRSPLRHVHGDPQAGCQDRQEHRMKLKASTAKANTPPLCIKSVLEAFTARHASLM